MPEIPSQKPTSNVGTESRNRQVELRRLDCLLLKYPNKLHAIRHPAVKHRKKKLPLGARPRNLYLGSTIRRSGSAAGSGQCVLKRLEIRYSMRQGYPMFAAPIGAGSRIAWN
jgi:hypothetical protein